MTKIIILGGGLSGLSAAYFLKKKGIETTILEAQNQVGGRIQTLRGVAETPMEMGATWFGEKHQHLIELLKDLNIKAFKQHSTGIALFETMSFAPPQQYHVPESSESSYRIHGGTSTVIDRLVEEIGANNIHLNTEIISIEDKGNALKLIDNQQNTFDCDQLIIAMPPKIALQYITFSPQLPTALTSVMTTVQTWMNGSTKFSVEYVRPFWRDKGYSGSVFSQCRLGVEIYDHSNAEDTQYALKGFLNGSASNYPVEERKSQVLAQLTYYYGEEAANYLSYNDRIWDDRFINTPNEPFLPPHYNNGHPALSRPYLGNKLFFAGAETSPQFGGYMDGAVLSARLAVEKIVALQF